MRKCMAALAAFTLGFGAVGVQAAPPLTARPSGAVVQAAPVAVPDPDVQVMLVQTALSALNHANLTNDYSVLHALAAPVFQSANSPDMLAAQFAAFRTANIDLTPAVLYRPRWSQPANVESGALRLLGKIPSAPQEVLFDISYILENGRWRLAGLSVGLAAPSRAQ